MFASYDAYWTLDAINIVGHPHLLLAIVIIMHIRLDQQPQRFCFML